MGERIVDNYMQVKDIFDQIIAQKPDFKEVVSYHIQFNSNVMNFEMEAQSYQNMLKNIQQKIAITRRSQYLSAKQRQGLILVSGNPNKKNKILLVNETLCDMIGYNSKQLIS